MNDQYLVSLMIDIKKAWKIIISKILLFLPIIFILLSVFFMTYIDKSAFDSPIFILKKLNIYYYLGLMSLLIAIPIHLIIKPIKLHIIVFLILIFVLYMELPRFMYQNGFQTEYFHQAQVFHVINYGTVTDKFYPYPKSDVTHAIFSAVFIKITSLEAIFTVSYIIPILLRLILATILVAIALSVKGPLSRITIIAIPMYVIICDTELAFTNHYIYALPIYAVIVFNMVINSNKKNQDLSNLLAITSLVFTHIYFGTILIISLIFFVIFTTILRPNIEITKSRQIIIVIVSLISLLWYGYVSEWSIKVFYRELTNTINRAFDKIIALKIDPTGYISSAYNRFGTIPIKKEYIILLWIKWITIVLFSVIIISYIVYVMIFMIKKENLKGFLIKFLRFPLSWLWILSGAFIFIYNFTTTAHPQRILESFIIPAVGMMAYLSNFIEKHNNIDILPLRSKITKYNKNINTLKIFSIITIILIIFSIIAIPFKILWYWGTSLTYIGFTEKGSHSVIYTVRFLKTGFNTIYFIGPTPYWYYSEIYSDMRFKTISLNAPLANVSLWRYNLAKFYKSINDNSIILIDFTSGLLPMSAKYNVSVYINKISSLLIRSLTQNSNIIYMNSYYIYIGYY